jgi:hypothetical protein
LAAENEAIRLENERLKRQMDRRMAALERNQANDVVLYPSGQLDEEETFELVDVIDQPVDQDLVAPHPNLGRERAFVCLKCGRRLLNKKTYDIHVKACGQGVRYDCPHCAKNYTKAKHPDKTVKIKTLV